MNNFDYPSNSYKSKKEEQNNDVPEKKRVEKVVTGSVKTKKNELRKLTDVFISEDVKNVKEYVFMDVLVPAIKKAIVDIVTDGVNMIFFGGNARSSGSTASKISYNKYYDRRDGDRRNDAHRTRSGYSYDDVSLESRAEAEEVLSRMDELIDTYGEVSVADLYDLVGVTGEYTDNRYGWTNIKNANVVRTRDGRYLIDLPKALPIDRR
jgi:hypothetical protein